MYVFVSLSMLLIGDCNILLAFYDFADKHETLHAPTYVLSHTKSHRQITSHSTGHLTLRRSTTQRCTRTFLLTGPCKPNGFRKDQIHPRPTEGGLISLSEYVLSQLLTTRFLGSLCILARQYASQNCFAMTYCHRSSLQTGAPVQVLDCVAKHNTQ